MTPFNNNPDRGVVGPNGVRVVFVKRNDDEAVFMLHVPMAIIDNCDFDIWQDAKPKVRQAWSENNWPNDRVEAMRLGEV